MRKILLGKLDVERRMIVYYTFSSMGVSLIYSLLIALYGARGLALILLLIALANAPIFFLLRDPLRINKASYYLITNGAVAMTLPLCFVGGLHGPAYWIGLLPLAGGLLLQLRGVIYSSLLAFISLIVLTFRDHIPGLVDLITPDQVYLAISLTAFILSIAFMGFLFLQTNTVIIGQQTRKLDNLLNIVTHDIANPLTLISGHAELLITQEQAQANTAHIQALKRIARASEMINEILRRVRQIQAAKAGKLQVETTQVSLQETFDKLGFVFEDRLRQKKQQLAIELPAIYRDACVWAEPVMLLNEVLSNLVSNAIKFSPIGSTINLRVARQGEFMRVEVRDHGIGIPSRLLPHVFDDFRSTSRPGTEGEVGTGFGLPLARHIVEAFGGTLQVESRSIDEGRRNSGTVFIVLLRIAASEKTQAKAS